MGMILGGLVMSLAGNFQAINLNGGRPGIGAYVSAFIWPSFLFGVIEVMLHTPWLANWRDRFTKGGALVLVAFVAAWISYWHLAHVMKAYGYDAVASHTGPLAVDIGMVLATLALDRVRKAGQLPPASAVTSGQEVDGQLANELAEWDKGVELAIGQAGQELANEVERYVATGHVAKASPVVDGERLAKPTVAKARADMAIPPEAILAVQEWLASVAKDKLAKGDFDRWLASVHNVSPRTARRWRVEVTGPDRPVSAPPEQTERNDSEQH
jgi:hypothetical protein